MQKTLKLVYVSNTANFNNYNGYISKHAQVKYFYIIQLFVIA